MADLPTNYLDDILAQSMNGKRKFRITRPDGTFEEVIIEDISEYSQTGSTFGAGDINRTNQAVNEKFDSEDVVDPMLTTEPGFAADAYKTKLQFDEQNKNLSNKVNCLVIHKSGIACTENTSVSLGAVSDLTKNVISKASDVKGIGVLNVVGSLKYDPSGSVSIRDNNNIYYYPGVTQSADITFFIVY